MQNESITADKQRGYEIGYEAGIIEGAARERARAAKAYDSPEYAKDACGCIRRYKDGGHEYMCDKHLTEAEGETEYWSAIFQDAQQF